MKLFKLNGISKKYALRAAHYRRVARSQAVAGLAFDEDALRELYDWESRGVGSVDKGKNGFAYGKWCVDLSVSMWIEDILKGNFCKAEFLGTRIQKLHNKKKLDTITAAVFFPYADLLNRRRSATHEPRRYPEGVERDVRSQQPFITGERTAKKTNRGAFSAAQSLVQD